MTPAIRIGEIKAATALVRQVTVNEMCAHRRSGYIVRTRQMGMTLAKELTLKSLPEIGRKFGGFDHTTVLHAIRKIDQLRQAGDPVVIRSLGAIRATLGLEAETAGPEIQEALVERVLNRLTARLVAGEDGGPELAAFTATVVDRVAERVAQRIDKANPARPAPPIMAAVRSTIDAAARLQRDDWSPGRRSAQVALDRNLNELRTVYETV